MFHHHQGGAGLVQAAAHGIADLQHAGRVQVGGRLVQEDQAGPHRQDAGQRKALFLPAREGRRRVVERKVAAGTATGTTPQPDVVERFMDPLPDLFPRHAKVLGAERDVVAQPGKHHLGFGVLLHESGTAPLGLRRNAVHQQRAGLVGVVTFLAQHARQGMQERRLARARGAKQQHTLAWTDVQVQGVDGLRGAASVPPAPALRGNGGGSHHSRGAGIRTGHQEKTGSEAALRDANALRTPVLARPRVAIQDRAPAMTAPEIVQNTMYASLSTGS